MILHSPAIIFAFISDIDLVDNFECIDNGLSVSYTHLLIVDRTPQHAAALLRIAHRLTIAVVRIVEVIAYFQPFEHL